MFFSFIFLGAGTFLTIITFAKSSEAEKYLCLGVVIVFIVATLFVANSLAQVPRGGLVKSTWVTPENITLTAHRVKTPYEWEGIPIKTNYQSESQRQVLHSSNYPVSSVSMESLWEAEIEIRRNPYLGTETFDPVNVTLQLWWRLKPYQSWQSRIWTESLRTLAVIDPYISLDWGSSKPANRTRLDRYDLEFMINFFAYAESGPQYLNFTIDMSDYRIGIDDYVVDSKFQNGLSITLSGIFIGINCCIPGKLLSELPFKKTRLQNQKL